MSVSVVYKMGCALRANKRQLCRALCLLTAAVGGWQGTQEAAFALLDKHTRNSTNNPHCNMKILLQDQQLYVFMNT